MKLTALNSNHKELNAKMVDFVGWEMPLLYSSIQKEHFAVRQDAGLFDVSHMGELIIKGERAEDFLSWVLPSNIRKVKIGSAFYSHILDHNGIIIDDTIAMRVAEDEFLLVPNASNTEIILEWFNKQNAVGAEIVDRTDELTCLALQGPKAEAILSTLDFIDRDLKTILFFTFGTFALKGEEVIVSRTGYTGEDGFELYIPNPLAAEIWDGLLEAGKPHDLVPTGLGCRDTLRLEKGFLLSGQDFHMDRTSLETGWESLVYWGKDFIGKATLEKQKSEGDFDILKAFLMKEKGIPRTGCPILIDGAGVGSITSGTMSPVLKQGIALGYIKPEYAELGTVVDIEIRGKSVRAELVKLPFV